MTKPLLGLSVLLVEDDPDTGELLQMALTSRGVTCRHVETGTAAMLALAAFVPDVILCDLALPDGSGLDWLARFRTVPGVAHTPAIAVSGRAATSDRTASLAAGFEKHLSKPASLVDIIAAVTIVTNRNGALALKATLSQLAHTTGCRYTSFLRFEQNELVSVWTYDRANEATDAFPLQMPIHASYCILVQEAGKMIVIENAANDPRAAGHAKQSHLATYVGAPVFGRDGVMYGTLCTYDEAPRKIGEAARAAVSNAAKELEAAIAAA